MDDVPGVRVSCAGPGIVEASVDPGGRAVSLDRGHPSSRRRRPILPQHRAPGAGLDRSRQLRSASGRSSHLSIPPARGRVQCSACCHWTRCTPSTPSARSDLVDRLHLLSEALPAPWSASAWSYRWPSGFSEAGRSAAGADPHRPGLRPGGAHGVARARAQSAVDARFSTTRRSRRSSSTADAPNIAELREIMKDIVGDETRAADVIRRVRVWSRRACSSDSPLDINGVVGEVAQLVRSDMASRHVPMKPGAGQRTAEGARRPRAAATGGSQRGSSNGIEAMREANGRGPRPSRSGRSRPVPGPSRWRSRTPGRGSTCAHVERIFEPLCTTKR
mgnify:CR=1 FL=1